jgi:Tfp pilus assembly ATPase PilU
MEEALRSADSQNEVRLMIKLSESGQEADAAGGETMSLIGEEEKF